MFLCTYDIKVQNFSYMKTAAEKMLQIFFNKNIFLLKSNSGWLFLCSLHGGSVT